MPESSGLTIGEVSHLLGVPVPTLRSWQVRYGLAASVRTRGGHRRYTRSDLSQLQAFNAALARGIAPRTVAQTLRPPWSQPDVPLVQLSALLDRAGACDPEGVCEALDDAERSIGLEQCVDRVLIPGLREIGRRWEMGDVDVGHEHLTTTAVRRWIARRVREAPGADVPSVLLAAAPGNRHTVALEAFELLLRRRGRPTRLLGADTPVASLLTVLQSTGAAAVVVTAQQVSRRRSAVVALEEVQSQPAVRTYYAGAAFEAPARRRGTPGTYLGTVLPAAAQRVEDDLSAV